MSNLTRLWETRLSVDTFSVLITLDAFKLSLRTAFGTSHSSTTSRTNALLAIEISHLDGTPVVSGVGESGMPPKKFGCYESDINDIVSFFSAFEVHLQSFGSVSSTDPMSSCPSQFLPLLRSSINLSTAGVIKHLLNALDSFPTTPFGYGYKAAHCCFEIACFDAWSRLLERPLYSLLTQESSEKQSLGGSFYTIGLDTTAEMVKNCHFGLKHTPLLKIKLDANVQRAAEILHQLHSVCQSQQVEYKWSIDANAAWIQPSIAVCVISPFFN
jgi:L-alanine-DL-glutamate epimerase-like enolase superfamily enzyme